MTKKQIEDLIERLDQSEADSRTLQTRLSHIRGELQRSLGYAGSVTLERSIELAEALDPTTGEPNDVEY